MSEHEVVPTEDGANALMNGSSNEDGGENKAIGGRNAPKLIPERPDTRHVKSTESTGNLLPLSISNKLGYDNSLFPTLVELYKPSAKSTKSLEQPINLKGDSGMIGRVSTISSNLRSMSDDKSEDIAERKINVKREASTIVNDTTDCKVLRLDIKGDVYHGSFTNSNACICAVSVNPGKEAKIEFVFNHYVQARYQGNVLQEMQQQEVEIGDDKVKLEPITQTVSDSVDEAKKGVDVELH